MKNYNNLTTKKISLYALATALVTLATLFFRIPMPLGYANLGGCLIWIIGAFIGPVAGFVAGGLGSGLADLISGYASWSIPSIIIKGLMGYLVGKIINLGGKSFQVKTIRTAISIVLGEAWCVLGYILFGIVLFGSLKASMVQAPGLLLEGGINFIAFYVIAIALESVNFKKIVSFRQK